MMVHLLKRILPFALLPLLFACQLPSGDSGKAYETWYKHQATALNTPRLAAGETHAVFYRDTDDSNATVNLYINGNYQASLNQQTQTSLILCSGEQRFSTADSNSQNFGTQTQSEYYLLPPQSTVFFKIVRDTDGKPKLQPTDSATANQELKHNKGTAIHTHTRAAHKHNCTAADNTK